MVNGIVSQTAGWELGEGIEVLPVLGECNRVLIGSRLEGERERVGVADVAVNNADDKGDFDVGIKEEAMDDFRLLVIITVSCGCKAPMHVIGSDTDPEMSIAHGEVGS